MVVINRLSILAALPIVTCLVVAAPARSQQPSPGAGQAASGLVTRASAHDVADTVRRFTAVVGQAGWKVFATLDHAAAARDAGLELSARTVVLFGNPRGGTPAMRSHPTLALDLPMRALIWEDDAGKVWLTHDSAEHLARGVFPRHGATMPPPVEEATRNALAEFSRQATQ